MSEQLHEPSENQPHERVKTAKSESSSEVAREHWEAFQEVTRKLFSTPKQESPTREQPAK